MPAEVTHPYRRERCGCQFVIYEMKNKQLMMRKNVKGKAVTRMSLHGPLSLVETPMSYPFCTIGNLTLYVDGSQAVSGSVDTVICPCLAWSLPKSADDAETTMVLDDETFTVDISCGPITQSFECTAKVLRIKNKCDGDALARPLLPSEVAKSKKRKATHTTQNTRYQHRATCATCKRVTITRLPLLLLATSLRCSMLHSSRPPMLTTLATILTTPRLASRRSRAMGRQQ